MLSEETATGALHRARLRDQAAPTALTNLLSGGLARGLVNRLMRELGPVSEAAPTFPLASSALAPLRAQAEAQGHEPLRRQGIWRDGECERRRMPGAGT